MSKIHPVIDDLHPPQKSTELKFRNSGSCLDSFKSQVKLKRAKSTENLPLRDRNQLDLKQHVASRSMNSKSRMHVFNRKPLYFETLDGTRKAGLQTVFVYPRKFKTTKSIDKTSQQQNPIEVQNQTPFFLDEFQSVQLTDSSDVRENETKKKLGNFLLIAVIVLDSVFLLRLLPAILTLWKPKYYIGFYRLYRLATCLALIFFQIILLFVNLLHTKVLIRENTKLTAFVHVLILLVTSIIDSAFCWVVSTTLISTIKSQRKMFAKQRGRQL